MERLAPDDGVTDHGRDHARLVSGRGTLSLPDAAWALDRITLGAVTTGMALLPGDGGAVTGRAWLRALRTLLDELVRPMDWFGNEGRGGLARAWLRAGRMLDARHRFQGDAFEHLPAEQRGVLLQVAGAVVRQQAVRPARHGPGTMLRAYATQWNSDQLCTT